MSKPLSSTRSEITVEPIVRWPRTAVIGQDYLVEVWIEATTGEGIALPILLDGAPHLRVRAVEEPRFTLGSMEPVRFVMTAHGPAGERALRLTLCAPSGRPLRTDRLPIAVRATADPDPGFQLNEPTAVDLRAKTAGAWREFATALTAVLSALAPGAEVHLALDPAASGTGTAVYPIRIRVSEDGVVQAYAVGNAELPEGYRLDRSSVGDLIALGWSPPGVLPGSGNSFSLRSSRDSAKQLAMVVSRTLRDVCAVPHPAFLVYFAHDDATEPIETAPLGAARHRSAPDAVASSLVADRADERVSLAERVRAVIAATLRISVDELSVDVDGDIGIRAGSAMLFIRVRDNPQLIDVFSPVLTEVEPSERLYARLSELTNVMPIGRLYHVQDTVWASIPVFGRNFQAAHLMLAVQVMASLADELDDRLQDEFGGSRFFGDPKPASS